MVGESNQNVFLIQIDASSFTNFEISEFDMLRVDFMCISYCLAFRSFTVLLCVSGTDEERGVAAWRVKDEDSTSLEPGLYREGYEVYDPLLPRRLLASPILRYVPFLPYRPGHKSKPGSTAWRICNLKLARASTNLCSYSLASVSGPDHCGIIHFVVWKIDLGCCL